MALEPITRQEKIIAGENLTPITRMEKFLKQYGGGGGGGGGSIMVDSELSDTSTNPVQNKVIKSALDAKLETPFVVTLTTNMENGVTTSDKSVDEIRTALRLGKDVKAVSKYTFGDREAINGHSIYCLDTGEGIAFLFVHCIRGVPSITENVPYYINSIYMTDTNIILGSSDNQVTSLYTNQLCLRSKSGNKWFEISVDDSGTLTTTEVL